MRGFHRVDAYEGIRPLSRSQDRGALAARSIEIGCSPVEYATVIVQLPARSPGGFEVLEAVDQSAQVHHLCRHTYPSSNGVMYAVGKILCWRG